MITNRPPPEEGEAKRYLVECEGCLFEQTADSRVEAKRIGSDHHTETGHEVVAVEMPPSREFS